MKLSVISVGLWRRLGEAVMALVSAGMIAAANPARAFEDSHREWDVLLKAHVIVSQDGRSSRLDYAGMREDRAQLDAYLVSLSGVTQAEFISWSGARRLAFLINAYNAFTVQIVLQRYPALVSIKDLGSLLSSPWKRKFFRLLGAEHSLDDIEHGMIRKPGAYDEPRIHTALNCASIGCPMLRNEAYVADRLDAQLEDSMRRFLGDRSRNRFDPSTGQLRVSPVFDWYRGDFVSGPRGASSLAVYLGRYSEVLSDRQEERGIIAAGKARIVFLDYDWRLNDGRKER